MKMKMASRIPVGTVIHLGRREGIIQIVNEICQYAKTRARNVTKNSLNLAIEVTANDQKNLIDRLMRLEGITSASIVEHDGNISV